jgi:hypothetical protein
MFYSRPCAQSVSSVLTSTSARKEANRVLALGALLLTTLTCPAQEQQQTQKEPDPQLSQTQQEANNTTTVSIPAGTRIALVLTQPIQSRYLHRGDDIYAQTTSPVNSGNELVIPPGTFVQGKVDKLDRRGGRAELHLQSMSITFPDGYVAPLSGPVTLTSADGYAFRDPGPRRSIGVFALPLGGAGLGALIGHSVGKANSQVASTLPPGCVGGPPFCVPINTPVFGTKGQDAIIGAGIGGAIGGLASIALLFSSRGFFLDVGSPAEMVLQQPISMPQDQVAEAIREAEKEPAPQQPVAARPQFVPPPDNDSGTCYTPGTPGTPASVIPGAPGPDGVPGPPTIIPGTPPTPPTPHPCP